MTSTSIVVIGGGRLAPVAVDAVRRRLPATLIAADSGLDHAFAAGLQPDVLVGDLDSVSPEALAWATELDLEIETYPADKDATDTDLAVRTAGRRHPDGELLVVGGRDHTDDRLDHLLGSIGVIGGPGTATFRTVSAYLGTTRLAVAHPGRDVRLDLEPGTVLSVLALHGPCRGVNLRGTRWELDHADLPAGSSRGVSNTSVQPTVQLSVHHGTLTVVIP